MPRIPDLNDPRYLNEVGWFLYREKYGYNHHSGSYDKERLVWSEMFLDEFLKFTERDIEWLADKSVVSIGSGCTGDLTCWPSKIKVAIDPLLYTYQQLGMLIDDAPGTNRTVYLSTGIEDIPLLDEFADIVLCRNAFDHMPEPKEALLQISRILKKEGLFYLSVDIGGQPTPDEPSPFTMESLITLLESEFEILSVKDNFPPFNEWRDYSVRITSHKNQRHGLFLNKDIILKAYEEAISKQVQNKL